ncbi:MAG: precorrin-3B synthase [Thioalkalivibrio sp.]|nr:MAG: precorrin-3B synthase [Thioalkalivibrio sp.]
MYKRPARLLVAAVTDDGRARLVKDVAGEPALAEWLEVRPARSMEDLRREDLEWADLLVAVDAEAAEGFPAQRPVNCRLKRWALPPAGSPDVEAAALLALQCMAGGMRMLSRMDAEDL